ncbi:MAG: response regulator [Planctomycetaceae bacterium]|nr:response regulator [Planctomycetales bacterium]MCB9874898.1 response regulator [Planctomycetaceae bacterium]MCB9939165.1 response regulator [Planctomycetaceae bacterium]HRX80062.1 response regulator [Pirellulaceae bacterium]
MPNGKNLGRPVEILLVEDSPSDALLAKEALRQGKVKNTLHHVEDGVEAMAFLRKEPPFIDAPRPDVILLDLNLPRMSGQEVLKAIRDDKRLSSLSVIVLTTSSDERDVLAAYGLKANCYITKPVDMQQFIATMQALEGFWLTWVTLPPGSVE